MTLESHHDYIVIGSGAAGGVVARNLQDAGADVLLLEAGRRFDKHTFPVNEADAAAQLYWGGGLELTRDASMGFLRARAVGGTTIVNQALLDRFCPLAFDDWRNRTGIDFFCEADMDVYYRSVESFLSCHTFTDNERNGSSRLVSQAMDRLGLKWKYLRRGQSDCAGEKSNDCIACLGGCHRDSKQSSLVTYIRAAENKGLRVSDQTEVHRIEPQSDGTLVQTICRGKRVVFKANRLILCAGAFGTTRLLLNSGLKKHYPALGSHFASHPQFMSFGRFEAPVNAHQGYFQTIASNHPPFREQGFKIEVVYAPPVSLAILFPAYGVEHQRLMRDYTHYACVEIAIRDENNGRLNVDRRGRLVIDKPLTDVDRQKRDCGLHVVRQIMETAGAREVLQSPVYFGLHLMGGASIGTDSRRSVVNPEFQLHHHDKIFVVDSSIFPSAPGINPSLTIFALGEKLSQQLGRATT